jgi:isopentenyl phosphate kinase
LAMKGLAVIKLGGSVITVKGGVPRPNLVNLRRLLKEIAQANRPFVLVHGGGSYGHYAALKYRVGEGKGASSPAGASRTIFNMVRLNAIVTREMISAGFPTLAIPPHAFDFVRDLPDIFVEQFQKSISAGFVPVTYGDVVLDQDSGYRIVSGDYLASRLAVRLGASLLVFGTDVDGVYRSYPPRQRERPIAYLTRKVSFGATSSDATGGIAYKAEQALLAAEGGVTTLIVNASKPGVLRRALQGRSVRCTRVSTDGV